MDGAVPEGEPSQRNNANRPTVVGQIRDRGRHCGSGQRLHREEWRAAISFSGQSKCVGMIQVPIIDDDGGGRRRDVHVDVERPQRCDDRRRRGDRDDPELGGAGRGVGCRRRGDRGRGSVDEVPAVAQPHSEGRERGLRHCGRDSHCGRGLRGQQRLGGPSERDHQYVHHRTDLETTRWRTTARGSP